MITLVAGVWTALALIIGLTLSRSFRLLGQSSSDQLLNLAKLAATPAASAERRHPLDRRRQQQAVMVERRRGERRAMQLLAAA